MPRHRNRNLILKVGEQIIIGDDVSTRVTIYHNGDHLIAEGLATDEELVTTSGVLQIQIDNVDGGGYTP